MPLKQNPSRSLYATHPGTLPARFRRSRVLIVGCGDVGQRVAQALVAEPALSASATELAARHNRGSDAAQTQAAPVAGEPSRLVAAPIEARKLTPMSKLFRRVVWPSVAMAAAVASVVWVAKPLFVPELSAPATQTAKANTQSPVATNLEASAVRDYVTAHRQISGPSNVRPASFGASR